MPPLPTNNLKPPHLLRRPPTIQTLNIRMNPLGHPLLPAVSQERLADLIGQRCTRQPLRPALHLAEQPVAVLLERVVEGAQLGGTLDAARSRLLDVDVHYAVLLVLLDGERDRGEADALAREPGDALQGEAGLDAVGEGFVLGMGVSFFLSFQLREFWASGGSVSGSLDVKWRKRGLP